MYYVLYRRANMILVLFHIDSRLKINAIPCMIPTSYAILSRYLMRAIVQVDTDSADTTSFVLDLNAQLTVSDYNNTSTIIILYSTTIIYSITDSCRIDSLPYVSVSSTTYNS